MLLRILRPEASDPLLGSGQQAQPPGQPERSAMPATARLDRMPLRSMSPYARCTQPLIRPCFPRMVTQSTTWRCATSVAGLKCPFRSGCFHARRLDHLEDTAPAATQDRQGRQPGRRPPPRARGDRLERQRPVCRGGPWSRRGPQRRPGYLPNTSRGPPRSARRRHRDQSGGAGRRQALAQAEAAACPTRKTNTTTSQEGEPDAPRGRPPIRAFRIWR